MIPLATLRPDAPWYRVLTTEWAHLPESGTGAAQKGDASIPPRLAARYLAGNAETAAREQ